MWTRGLRIAVVLMASWAMPPPTPARAESAEALLQGGLHQEEILGDLPRAIESYEKVLEIHARNRRSAARAQYRIGRCRAKMGDLEKAGAAYRVVIEAFADEADVVARARAAMLRIHAAEGSSAGLELRLLLEHDMLRMNPHRPAEFDFAADGDRIVFRDRSKLQVSGGVAVLRPIADVGAEFWPLPRWSPDGDRIAYMAGDGTGEGRRLWIVGAAGGEAQALAAGILSRARSLSWTPDGTAISCLVPGTGLVTVDFEGGSRVTRLPSPPSMRIGPYSPDGRWLAASVVERGSPSRLDRDLWLVPAAGGELVRLTDTPGLDAHPTWSPGGEALYFVSSRGGAWNIWELGVDGGRPTGEPRQVTDFSDAETMFPAIVNGGERLAFGMVRTRRSVLVADASDPSRPWHVARGRKPMPAPEGGAVFYLGEGPGRDGVFSVPDRGGAPTRLAARGPVVGPGPSEYDVSVDGRWLAYGGIADGVARLLLQPTAGGLATVLCELAGGAALVPRFSPDGARLAFVRGGGVFVIPTSGGEPREVARRSHWNQLELAWSPDGRYLAALGQNGDAVGDAVYLIEPEGGGTPRRLTSSTGRKEGLAWHPDGKRLIYLCWLDEDGRDTELRQVANDGTEPRILVNEPFQREGRAAWSPDGRWLYFESIRGPGRAGVWRRDDRDGALSLFAEDATLPRWSRDARSMAWTVVRRRKQLWTMDLTEHRTATPGGTE